MNERLVALDLQPTSKLNGQPSPSPLRHNPPPSPRAIDRHTISYRDAAVAGRIEIKVLLDMFMQSHGHDPTEIQAFELRQKKG
jgi:hypothetical protein